MRNSLVDVVAAALRVLGAQGLEGCSMRRVAAELGVQPSALYHHVPDKQSLLALMADDIVAGVGARARKRAAESREVPGAAGSRPAGTGSAVTRPMAMGPVGSDSAEVNRRVARCMCEELRSTMLATRDGADVVATAAAFRMGASDLEDELAELVGRDGARTLLIYTFGQAQQTQMHRQAAAFGALLGAPADSSGPAARADRPDPAGPSPTESTDGLDEAFARGLDVILTGLAA
ncbi:TetR/AcrR family transcriptional regulator [Leucobacter salsicius]|uniref:TetR/AcrR family transcriptional regulator n=1 Tax=Leucobacter salsicius TaxID=664638 RepID=UPI00034974EC|nr:helix-turn-helix domain-containing protein [Leucobacter salsicius]